MTKKQESKNKSKKCFQCAITVALDHKHFLKDPQII